MAFTALEGVDPNPGRELTDQFKELGWTWRGNEPEKPWVYQLEKSSMHDPTARGDSRDALHEQFLLIIQEYRQKLGMPPTLDWPRLAEADKRRSADQPLPSGIPAADAARMEHIIDLAVEFAQHHMKPSGALLVKCFNGQGYSQIVEKFKREFVSVSSKKPKASRDKSSEIFLLGRTLKNPVI